MRHRRIRIVALATFLVLAVPAHAVAADVTWIGGGATNDWHDDANWDTGDAPTGADDVHIVGDAVSVTTDWKAHSVTLVGASLDVGAPWDADLATFSIDALSTVTQTASIDVAAGSAAITNDGRWFLGTRSLTTSGVAAPAMTVGTGGVLDATATGGTAQFDPQLVLQGGALDLDHATVDLRGLLVDGGTITTTVVADHVQLTDTSTPYGFALATDAFVTGPGMLDVAAPLDLDGNTIWPSGLTHLQVRTGGTLAGDGMVVGGNVRLAGAPVEDAATITFNGSVISLGIGGMTLADGAAMHVVGGSALDLVGQSILDGGADDPTLHVSGDSIVRNSTGTSTIGTVFDVDGASIKSIGSSTIALDPPATGSNTFEDAAFDLPIAASTLRLGGSNVLASDLAATGNGTIELVAAGATLDLAGHDVVLQDTEPHTKSRIRVVGGAALLGGGSIVGGRTSLGGQAFGSSNAYDLSSGNEATLEAALVLAGSVDVDVDGTLELAWWDIGAAAHTGTLTIGGTGTLLDRSGAEVEVAPDLVVDGTVEANSGTDLTLTGDVAGLDDVAGDMTLAGGTWRSGAASAINFVELGVPIDVLDGATVDTSTVSGLGRVDLEPAITGALDLVGDAALVARSGATVDVDLTLEDTATVQGAGTIDGAVTLQESGTTIAGTLHVDELVATTGSILPGDDHLASTAGLGTLVVDGHATLGAAASLVLRLVGASSFDRFSVGGELEVIGSPSVTFDSTGFIDPAYSLAPVVVPYLTIDGDVADIAFTATHPLTVPKAWQLIDDGSSLVVRVTESEAPTGPTAATSTPDEGDSTNGAIVVTVSGAADGANGSGVAGYRVVWDHVATGTAPTSAASLVVGPALSSGIVAAGTWYLHARAEDARGNLAVATFDAGPFFVDTVGPAAPGVSGAPGATTAATDATLTLSTEAGATYRCWIDDVERVPCASPVSLVGLTVGAHAFRARAVDAAGNEGTDTSVAWSVLDTTAPVAPSIAGAPSGTTAATGATLVLSGEAGATFRCSLDGAAFTACGSPVVLAGLADGAHGFRATAVDAAGNVSVAAEVAWTVSATVPVVVDPSAPVKPAPGRVKLVPVPKLLALGRTGQLGVRVPVLEAGVTVKVTFVVPAAQARTLGLPVRRGQRSVILGTGTATSTKAGNVTVKVRLTRPVKTAVAALAARATRTTKLAGALQVSLTRSGLSSSLATSITIKK